MSLDTSICRPVTGVVTAHQQREGEGFLVRRPFPTQGLDMVDPFLMLDEVGPVDYGPGEALGAPDHPHRGFETISYILEGGKLHEDSTGQSQLIGPGDVQWMTAGAGIVHSELPAPELKKNGGRAHGFQIWVNLPARAKGAAPGYQYIPRDRIPTAQSADGRVRVTVIAGQAMGVLAAIDTHTPVWLQDWRIAPGGVASLPIDPAFNAAAYVIEGRIAFGPPDGPPDGPDDRVVAERGQLALFGAGDELCMAAVAGDEEGGRFLLLAGLPIAEPVARHGPFVMNTREELIQAFEDFESGGMGRIVRRQA